ncbi:MAG: hypothetical protein Fur0034_21220 [Desulfuromonadia bacterium]
MTHPMERRLLIVIAATLLPLLPGEGGAVFSPLPAITCHCFTDRTYDPARPAAADPYFLAVAENAFFSRLFGVDRKGVVLKKQQGVPGDDLWIAYGVSLWSNTVAETLLSDRKGGKGWMEILSARGIDPRRLGERTARELEREGRGERIARGVVDDLIISRRLMDRDSLDEVRRGGTENREVILLLVLSRRSGRSPAAILQMVRRGERSWGGLLSAHGLDAAGIAREIDRLIPR